VAKKIVDEHLGKIEITSVVGHGTLIRVILPADPKKRLHSDGTHGPAVSDDDHTPPLPGDDD
jgi:hypothetical protein